MICQTGFSMCIYWSWHVQ